MSNLDILKNAYFEEICVRNFGYSVDMLNCSSFTTYLYLLLFAFIENVLKIKLAMFFDSIPPLTRQVMPR